MTGTASLAAAARRRFAELDDAALRNLWATEGRTEWAEAALRDELIERGIRADELDAVATRRAEMARDKPPSSRDTIWLYGVAGRIAAIAAAALVSAILRAMGESRFVVCGLAVVFGIYAAILLRRISLQSKYRHGAAAGFAMTWQAGEACLLLVGFALAALLT